MIGILAGVLGRSPALSGLMAFGLVGALAWGGIQTVRIDSLKNDVLQAQLQQQVAEAQVASCRSEIDTQNERIADLAEDRTFRDGMIDMLRENVERERDRTDRTITTLMDAPTPENCEAAMQFLRDGIGDFR